MRIVLTPVVAAAKLMLALPRVAGALMVMSLIAGYILSRRCRRRARQ
jgi:hypothetical protein